MKESNAYCAQACIDWAPRIPEISSSWATFYVATQAGYACFCGAEEHAQRYLTEANKVADTECNTPCGCPGQCPEGTGTGTESGPSPAGKAGETCGAGWRNTTMRVSCGFQWGAYFLIVFTVSSALYVVAGVLGPWRRGSTQGLTVKQALMIHPHYQRWLALAGLVADGASYVGARYSDKMIPQPRRVQHGRCDGSSGRGRGRGKGEGKGQAEREQRRTKEPKDKRSNRKSKSRTALNHVEPEFKDELIGPAESKPVTKATLEDVSAAPAPSGTAAGGGGRWVHIPN